MASMKVLGCIPLDNTFLDDLKKCKKKAKKLKREKLDKQKSQPKGQESLKDYDDICDSNLSAQWPENKKKKKRKKKPDVSLNEEFPLTQNKNKLSKRRKNRDSNCAVDARTAEHGVRSGPGEQEAVQPILSSIQKAKKRKKRVAFNLSPVLLEPKPLQNPFLVRNILQTQYSGTDKKPTFNTVFPADGRHSQPAMEENGMESQSTLDDINSQDLFITQKSFSDPYIDLCSSTSAEEALEPQGYTETCPEPQSYTASSTKKRSCPEPQSYTASSAKKRSSPEPQSYTSSSAKKWSCREPHTAPSPRKRSCPEPHSYAGSSTRKRSCPEPHSYAGSSTRKRSCPEPHSYAGSSPRKRSCPETHSYTVSSKRKWSSPEHQSSPRKPSHLHKLNASTQTENFFTSPLLATSLRFSHCSTCTEEPMDLSLMKKSRLHHSEVVSKPFEDQHHPELNVTVLTQSDDSDSHLKSKADLSQIKVVQTRLNESFFFRLKGEGDSPKPSSPLMKFSGSVEKKKL